MSSNYNIIADDGMGNVVKVEMSREELCQFIGDSIFLGVLASAKIEGENVDDLEKLNLKFDLPEEFLLIEE